MPGRFSIKSVFIRGKITGEKRSVPVEISYSGYAGFEVMVRFGLHSPYSLLLSGGPNRYSVVLAPVVEQDHHSDSGDLFDKEMEFLCRVLAVNVRDRNREFRECGIRERPELVFEKGIVPVLTPLSAVELGAVVACINLACELE